MQSLTSAKAMIVGKDKRKLYCLLAASLASLIFILSFSSSSSSSASSSTSFFSSVSSQTLTLKSKLSSSSPPSVAYFISGINGDIDRLLRLLSAVYHPKNHYLLHLDLSAPQEQREQLAFAIQSVSIYRTVGNVNVIGEANHANPRGPTALSSILRGASILMRLGLNWDWFINLSASDYPLVTQDDFLHILSFLPRDMNFVQHSSRIGWRESRRMKHIIVDPGLYLSSQSDIFYATQKRILPNSYRLFTGLPSVILSRRFVEYCILGQDNLPRILLMYQANMHSPHTNYFQTILCNTRKFKSTILNNNLQYVAWDDPPRFQPRSLNFSDFNKLTQSGAAFGSSFLNDDPILDQIDQEILHRNPGKVVSGGWCIGKGNDPCNIWGDIDILRPGEGAKKLEKLLVEQLKNQTFRSQQCIFE